MNRRDEEINKEYRLHQRLTRAAIAYNKALENGDYDTVMKAAQELEESAVAWATR